MNDTNPQYNTLYKITSIFISCITVLIGILVILGWHTQISFLTKPLPNFIPMYYDTALCFIFCGIGLIFLYYRQKLLCRAASICILVWAVFTLLEFLFDTRSGIELIFMKFYEMAHASYPGRMAPNSAFGFLLTGISLLLLSFELKILRVWSECISLFVIALSGIAIIGYIEGLENAYTIGPNIGMALYTAIGFFIIHLGLLSYIKQYPRIKSSSIPIGLPIFLGLLVLHIDLHFTEARFTGTLHIPLLFCSLWFRNKYTSFVFASIISVYIVLGYYMSPSIQIGMQYGFFNRTLLIIVIWIISYLVYLQKNSQLELLKIQANLEEMVGDRVQKLCEEMQIRQSIESELKENKDQFQVIFDKAATGISLMTPEGQWLNVNQKLCQIVGYTKEELLQKTFHDITHPDDLENDVEKTNLLLQGKIDTFSMEKRYIRKDQSNVWVNLTVSGIFDQYGKAKYILKVVEDISNRKELESQLLQSQKMESIGQLAGGVAHDFNNILMVIDFNTVFALNKLKDDQSIRDDLNEVLKASKRASALTRQLLAFSRKQILDLKVLNINNLTQNLDKMLRRLIGEDIDLLTNLNSNLGNVYVDSGQFEQIVLNLVVNARDAMPNGGKITIETRNVELDENYSSKHLDISPGSFVMLAVSDNGFGMDSKTVEKIFEPFFTTKEKNKGTGLGLSTVYGIVKQCGGSIYVYSEPGQGTTFRIYLPRVNEKADELLPETIIQKEKSNGTILVVEDDDSVRSVVTRLLKNAGYKVYEVSNGKDALNLCGTSTEKIDLLLTDVIMPEMSGKQLANQIKENIADIKVMFMSGYTDNVIVHHGVLDEGVVLVQKPFNSDDLLNKVSIMLAQ